MTKKTILFITTSFIVVLSCMREVSPNSECAIDQSTYQVTKSDAVEVTHSFFINHCQKAFVKSNASSNDSFFSLRKNNTTYAYAVNFSDGGFAIVSADKRMNPILAYSETGNINADTSTYPTGFLIWLNDVIAEYEAIIEGHYDEEVAIKNSLMWNKMLAGSETRSIPVDPSLPDLIDTTVGPLLSTYWYDNTPFINYLPPHYDTTGIQDREHVWAGSSTVSVARLLHYHQHPSSFNWSSMPLTIASNDTTDYPSLFGLYSDVFSKIDNFKGFNRYYEYTAVKEVFYLDLFLKNQYGFTSATQINYNRNSNIVKSELLDHMRPVVFSGDLEYNVMGPRQYWICDGVHAFEDVVYDETGQPHINGYLYFHESWMRYGFPPVWLGHANFTLGSIHGTPISYSKNMRLVYQIIP